MPRRAAVQQCCACLRICCGSSWTTDQAASARWPWPSARWAPTSCRWTSWSAGPGYAIDDLVVELPPGAMPDTLITAAEELHGVRVDSLRPHTGLLEAHRELELIDHVAAAGDNRGQAAGAGRRGAPGAAGRLVHRAAQLAATGFERIAGSPGAPETRADRRPWLPIDHADRAGRTRRLGAAGVARHGHHAGRRAAGRPATPPSCSAGRAARSSGRRRSPGWATWPGSSRPSCADASLRPGIHRPAP